MIVWRFGIFLLFYILAGNCIFRSDFYLFILNLECCVLYLMSYLMSTNRTLHHRTTLMRCVMCPSHFFRSFPLGVGDIPVDMITQQKFGLSSLSRLRSRDVAVLRGQESLSFACVFKHCGSKTTDFIPLKRNKQRKTNIFSI